MMHNFIAWLEKIDVIGVVKWYNSLTLRKRFEIRTTFIFLALIVIALLLSWLVILQNLEHKKDITLLNEAHAKAIIEINNDCNAKVSIEKEQNQILINQWFVNFQGLKEDYNNLLNNILESKKK